MGSIPRRRLALVLADEEGEQLYVATVYLPLGLEALGVAASAKAEAYVLSLMNLLIHRPHELAVSLCLAWETMDRGVSRPTPPFDHDGPASESYELHSLKSAKEPRDA